MKELSTTYEPQGSEDKIYKYWEEKNCFGVSADNPADPFSIVIPPPNVTGVLHMGHALDGTLQDILIRYNRMKGNATLWLPGCDHAGIATQNVVEKKLREQGESRFDYGREKFVDTVWDWANDHKGRILDQFKRLGASFDRSRERFTLDEGCSEAVKEVFVNLYEKGLIYRGSYIVNWCPRCRSAISDIETEYKEEQGNFWEISYPLKDRIGAIVIATTRPETLFGDAAIAVHPEDPRYADLIGEKVVIPLTNKEISIVADEYVDKDFGTGALKITPAHDPNDYEVGKRHGLKPVWIMDKDGNMMDHDFIPKDIRGLERYEARKKTIDYLEMKGQLIRVLPHEHSVGKCQRCSTTIEPYLSEQWFVKMEPLVKRPIEAIEKGELKFVPQRWTKTYLDWLENIRDWCISRQLWWGHQIPAYYHNETGEMVVAKENPDPANYTQDNDVLDTWFSSALWPFSTMGWPDKESADFKKFYPTSMLVTGFDIIFFWVSRMVVMGYEFTDKSPFETVYIHGLVRDDKGQKMSKSTGNTIDPVEIIDKYGCDALRFTLTSLVTYGGQDIKISDEKFEYGRNFANKIWNASRFVLMNLEGIDNNEIDMDSLTVADKWILDKFNQTSAEINRNFDEFRIGEYTSVVYDFFRSNYCDWYVEIAKVQLRDEKQKLNTQRVLRYVLEGSLKLLHPVMPHITEELWQAFDHIEGEGSIMLAKFPEFDVKLENNQAQKDMAFAIDVIRGIRNIRQSLNIQVSSKIAIQVYSEDTNEAQIFENIREILAVLAKVENMEVNEGAPSSIPPQSATGVVSKSRIIIPLKGLIDIDAETARQKKKHEKLEKEKKSLEGRLKNPKFVESAPEEVVKQAKERVEEINQEYNSIEELLKSLV